jgi:hypothetical protein
VPLPNRKGTKNGPAVSIVDSPLPAEIMCRCTASSSGSLNLPTQKNFLPRPASSPPTCCQALLFDAAGPVSAAPANGAK